MEKKNVKWHRMTAAAALAQLQTNAACGLSRKAAHSRRKKQGANTLFDAQRLSTAAFLRAVFADPYVLLFLFSLFCVFLSDDVLSAIATLAVVVLASVLLIRLCVRLSSMHERIRAYQTPTVFVLRDGAVYEISARDVVRGDILFLQKGDIVPADCRVLDTDGEVVTRLVYRDTAGQRVGLKQRKRADVVYPYESTVSAPACENILYGKSEIIEGNARALVTEIGEYTFMGALLRTNPSTRPSPALLGANDTDRLLRAYSVLILILVIPLTLIGYFTSPSELGITHHFLSLCAVCAVCAPTVLQLYLRSISADGYFGCVESDFMSDKRSLPKSVDVMDKLSDVTDVVVIGRCASSDGEMHLHRVALGNGEVSLVGGHQRQLSALCEAYELLFSAPAMRLATEEQRSGIHNLENPTLRAELRTVSECDIDALQIHSKRASARYEADRIVLDVQFRDADTQYTFTDQCSVLYACTGYELAGKIYPLEGEMRDNLFRFAQSSVSEGGCVTAVTRTVGQRTVLVAILSCREQVQPFLPSVLEELEMSGVRVSFFLQNDTEDELLYAKAAKLPRAILQCSKLAKHENLTKYAEKYRVFLGFDQERITDLIREWKREGRRVAVLGSSTDADGAETLADIRMACDPLTFGLGKRKKGAQDSFFAERQFMDSRYSRALSDRASLLLPYATQHGGGLLSLLNAVSVSRAVKLRTLAFVRYLVTVHLLRLMPIILGGVFGVGLPSAFEFLWCGWIFDVIALWWISGITVPQNRLRKSTKWKTGDLLSQKRVWLCPSLTGLFLWGYTLLMSKLGFFATDGAVLFLFLSFVTTQLIVLYQGIYSVSASMEWRDLIPSLILCLPVVAVLLLSRVLTPLQGLCGFADVSPTVFFSLPLAPCLYVAFFFLVPYMNFHKKGANR